MTDAIDVASRLLRLEDERALEALVYDIARTVDEEDGAGWLDCFTDDGVFSWAPSATAPPMFEAKGRGGREEWFAGHRVNNLVGTQFHVALHPRIVEINGDTALVRSAYMTLRKMNGALIVASTGDYEDRCRRCEDGRWRAVERRAMSSMMMDRPAA